LGKKRKKMAIQLSIVSDHELRLSIPDEMSENPQIHQKYVSATPGPKDTTFDHAGLLEVASYMHASSGLQLKFPDEIEALGWIMYQCNEDPPRRELALVMLAIMTLWMTECADSDECLAPPSREFLRDPEARKILRSILAMKKTQLAALVVDDE
jgi:hypothetical protein